MTCFSLTWSVDESKYRVFHTFCPCPQLHESHCRKLENVYEEISNEKDSFLTILRLDSQ